MIAHVACWLSVVTLSLSLLSIRSIASAPKVERVTAKNYPFSAIGHLEITKRDGNQFYCSGSLVGSDLVLTAYHCVWNVLKIIFRPNGLSESGMYSEWTGGPLSEKFDGSIDWSTANSGHGLKDWAIIRLKSPLGQKSGTFEVDGLSFDALSKPEWKDKLYLLGYPGALNNELHLFRSCNITVDAGEMGWVHNCNAPGGASGGPLFYMKDNRAHVVGAFVAGIPMETMEGILKEALMALELSRAVGKPITALALAAPATRFASAVRRLNEKNEGCGYTAFHICNRASSRETIAVAIAYPDPGRVDYISEGTWNIPFGSCRELWVPGISRFSGNVYFHAQSPSYFWGEDMTFCFDGSRFKHPFARRDADQGRCRTRKYSKRSIKYGSVNNWNIN